MYRFEGCTQEEVDYLKHIGELKMRWLDVESITGSQIIIKSFKVIYNEEIIAIVTISEEQQMYSIDEFEVVKSKRNNGHGKKIVGQLIVELDKSISLLAKDEYVAKFWQGCGFVLESESGCDEICMTYTK